MVDIDELDFEDVMLLPLTDNVVDNTQFEVRDKITEIGKTTQRPPLPPHLQKRRKSTNVSLAVTIPISTDINFNTGISRNKLRWQRAIKRVMSMSMDDPWEKFRIEEIPTETCRRHRYNAIKKVWVTDLVQVKMQVESFNRGAMRACYRLKKLVHGKCQKNVINYVAKCYIDEVERDVYFEDVRLQMDAKLWAEEYNRHNPPKKVDIIQMAVLEFINRDDSPLYHVEHFIEGDYVKYNSNSGFVHFNDETYRCTPQALSHFTFERSGHQYIVVDIQGVGDLYTDPQIHTANGEGYGDGNLGTKGMALFFHSHKCNRICKSLCLQPFDLSPNEVRQQVDFLEKQNLPPETLIRSKSIEYCQSPSSTERRDLTRLLKRTRTRTYSNHSQSLSSDVEEMCVSPDTSECGDDSSLSIPMSPTDRELSPGSAGSSLVGLPAFMSRSRHTSECECGSGTLSKEEERLELMMSRRHRPSTVQHELDLRAMNEEDEEDVISCSVLGNVHLDLAKYHELGRFHIDDNDHIDWDSAAYHLQQAARLGILEAILTLARIYLNLPRDILQGLSVPDADGNVERGFDYMVMAANAHDRASMIYLAKAYQTGVGLPKSRTIDLGIALDWYQKAVGMEEGDDSGMFDSTGDDPNYQLLAKQAEIYRQGGSGVKKWPRRAGDLYNEAAEEAMAGMRGKLANKYYMLAEECYGEEEEEEEEEEQAEGVGAGKVEE